MERQKARFQSITDNLKNKIGDGSTEKENMFKNPVPPLDRAQINRIDTNVQDLQRHLKEHLESMTANMLDRHNTTFSTSAIPISRTEAETLTNSNDIQSTSLASSANLDTSGAETAVNSRGNEGASEVKTFVWMDSNGNNIDPVKFWKDDTQYQTTYKISDVNRELDKNRKTKIGCILIGCGVNDLDDKTGSEVAEEILCTVDRIKHEHPGTSIVVGEITPYHQWDNKVEACNTILRERIGKEFVHLVKMDFLRDGTWTNFKSDRKHIKASSIPFFAGAYIAALRRAHNLPPKNRRLKQEQHLRRSHDQSSTNYLSPSQDVGRPPNLMEINTQGNQRFSPLPPQSPRRKQTGHYSAPGPPVQQFSSSQQNHAGYHNVPPPPILQYTQRNQPVQPNGRIDDRLKKIADRSPQFQMHTDDRDMIQKFSGFLEYMQRDRQESMC